MDLTNKCNIKCIYCNVQGDYHIEKGDMDIGIAETFFRELRDIGWNKTVREYRPFLNGDPLMMTSEKFNDFLFLGRRYLRKSLNSIYTNGANSSKARMFLTPLLDEVHITCSASTPDTYHKIHGVPLFHEVLETYKMLTNNHKKTYVHFVYNKYNQQDLENWKKIFEKAKLMISPIHYADEEINSLKVKDDESIKKAYEIGNTNNPEMLYFWHPCNCYNNLAISWKGEYLQCPNANYIYNYGKVGEVPIKMYWQIRAKNRLKNGACHNCNLKNRNLNMVTYVTSKWVDLF